MKQQFDAAQHAAIELRIANDGKSKSLVIAYLLWGFLGYFGMHNFYLGKPFRGFVELALMLGANTIAIAVGPSGTDFPAEATAASSLAVLAAISLIVMWLSDLFWLPDYARDYRDRLRERVGREMFAQR